VASLQNAYLIQGGLVGRRGARMNNMGAARTECDTLVDMISGCFG
jgi:hypothetical protein